MILKRKKLIIAILIILAILFIYSFLSGYREFKILNIKKIDKLNEDGSLNNLLNAITECQKVEKELFPSCLNGITWYLGFKNLSCKFLNQFKGGCYLGYGRLIGKNEKLSTKEIESLCLKKSEGTDMCLRGASLEIGKIYFKNNIPKKCDLFLIEEVKKSCYEGIGRQLAKEGYSQDKCKEMKFIEPCLVGYIFSKMSSRTNEEKDENRMIEICNNLSDNFESKRCSLLAGLIYSWVQNNSKKASFKKCKELPYPDNCKKGVVQGLIFKNLKFYFIY